MRKLHDFPYQHVLVMGLARSGTAAAKVLLQHGVNVRVNDKGSKPTDQIVKQLEENGAEIVVGSHPLSVLEGIDLIVKNPGIPYEHPLLIEAMTRDIPIVTEIEIASKLIPGNLIGITGSNGKTTTTTLATKMLEVSEQKVKAAGNIGIVAIEVANEMQEEETMVLELSSFQLQGTLHFRPHIAVILNIIPAHLDYHKTYEQYKEAKYNIFKNQTEDDYFIYNQEDEEVTANLHNVRAKRLPFSTKGKLAIGASADEHAIYFDGKKMMDRADIALVGEHNVENILAAMSAAILAGATKKGIVEVLRSFYGVEHRLQFVTKTKGRKFYNDSKATNLFATSKAIDSFKAPVILLAGGLDRGDEFEELFENHEQIKAVVSFGQTKFKLHEAARQAGVKHTIVVEDVSEAVEQAYELSEENDIILLSPACASWDQYRTFEERGDIFMQAVHRLK